MPTLKHFKTQADEINLASEQRKAEEEFTLMKQHTWLERSNKPLISPEHFSRHFGPGRYNLQPELERPEDHSYILPPVDLPVIDTSVPDRSEIETGKRAQEWQIQRNR